MHLLQNNSPAAKSPILYILVGMAITAVGVFGFLVMRVDPSWTRITGQVSDFTESERIVEDGRRERSYLANISYMVGNKQYKIDSKQILSSPPVVGSEVRLAYNPAQPSEAKEVLGPIIYIILLFPIAGIYMLISGFAHLIKPRQPSEPNNDIPTFTPPNTSVTSNPPPTLPINPLAEPVLPQPSKTIITPTINNSPEAIQNHQPPVPK